MRKAFLLSGAALVASVMVGWGVVTRGPRHPVQDGSRLGPVRSSMAGPRIRRSLVDAEDTVREGLNRTGETVRDGFARTRETVQAMGLVPRVYGRLHWDKSLHSCQLLVKAEGGTVTIRGTVPDESAKAKVISLAKDTVGVTRVVVQLRVVAPGAAIVLSRFESHE